MDSEIEMEFEVDLNAGTLWKIPTSGPKTIPSLPPEIKVNNNVGKKKNQKRKNVGIKKNTDKLSKETKRIVSSILSDVLKSVNLHIKTIENEKKIQRNKIERQNRILEKKRLRDPDLIVDPINISDENTISINFLSKKKVKIMAYKDLLKYSSIDYGIFNNNKSNSKQISKRSDENMEAKILVCNDYNKINQSRYIEMVSNYWNNNTINKTVDYNEEVMNYKYPDETIPLNKASLWSLASFYNLDDWNYKDLEENNNNEDDNIIGTQHFQDFYRKRNHINRRSHTIYHIVGDSVNRNNNDILLSRTELQARIKFITASYQGEIDRRTNEIEEQIKTLQSKLNRWICDQIILRDNEVDSLKERYELAHVRDIQERNKKSIIKNDMAGIKINNDCSDKISGLPMLNIDEEDDDSSEDSIEFRIASFNVEDNQILNNNIPNRNSNISSSSNSSNSNIKILKSTEDGSFLEEEKLVNIDLNSSVTKENLCDDIKISQKSILNSGRSINSILKDFNSSNKISNDNKTNSLDSVLDLNYINQNTSILAQFCQDEFSDDSD